MLSVYNWYIEGAVVGVEGVEPRVQSFGFRFSGSGFWVSGSPTPYTLKTKKGLRCRVRGSVSSVQGLGFRVNGPGFMVHGSWFRAQGAGCRVQGPGSRV